MERANRLALLISFAVRNVGLATAIAVTIMNRIEYATFSTVYLLSEVALVLTAVVAFRTMGPSGSKTPIIWVYHEDSITVLLAEKRIHKILV